MTAARSVASALLRRTGLFSLVLALIAGIFGMHVLNGHHLMHGPASAVTAPESAAHSHHAHPSSSSGGAGDTDEEMMSAAAGCPDGDCSGTQAMTVSCIPSGKTGTLAAPALGSAVFGAVLVRAGPAGQARGSSAYRPATPTPCELSISRT